MAMSTIFGEAAPAGATWNAAEGPVSLGTVIEVLNAGVITHIRIPNHADYQGLTLTLWVATAFWDSPIGGRQTAARVAAEQRPSRAITASDSGAWIEFALSSPVPVTAGQVVMAGFWVPSGGGYYSRAGALTGGPITSAAGTMRAMQDGLAEGIDNITENGRYSYDAEPYWPLESFGGGVYFVDLRFDDSGPAPSTPSPIKAWRSGQYVDCDVYGWNGTQYVPVDVAQGLG